MAAPKKEASKKKVIVLGSTGMLGHAVASVLSSSGNATVYSAARDPERATALGLKNVLAFDAKAGTAALGSLVEAASGCDVFINCIAVLKPDIDENKTASIQNAIVINTFFPHELAAAADKIGAYVIHVSTDGVFTGESSEAYLEGHTADAADVYGKTKMLGEPISPRTVSVRSSFIGFDPGKKRGLLEWFLAQPEGAELNGFTNHYWSGVTTLQFAQLCAKLLIGEELARLRKESSIHHFSPNGAVSKFELLQIFRRVFEKNVAIHPTEGPGGAAHRALSSRYNSLRNLFGTGLSLESAVSELRSYGR